MFFLRFKNTSCATKNLQALSCSNCIVLHFRPTSVLIAFKAFVSILNRVQDKKNSSVWHHARHVHDIMLTSLVFVLCAMLELTICSRSWKRHFFFFPLPFFFFFPFASVSHPKPLYPKNCGALCAI